MERPEGGVPDRLKPAGDDVAAKVIDGEAIIMNLANGFYYSLNGVGADVWEGIERGLALPEIAAALGVMYEVEWETAAADVERLALQLLDERLVVPEDPGPAGGSSNDVREAVAERRPYRPPQLEKYTDMAEMLALDPPMPGVAATPEADAEGAG